MVSPAETTVAPTDVKQTLSFPCRVCNLRLYFFTSLFREGTFYGGGWYPMVPSVQATFVLWASSPHESKEDICFSYLVGVNSVGQ